MPTMQDVVDEVQTLAAELRTRVDDLDTKQKKLGEDLTSKTATAPAEDKAFFEKMNARLNGIEDALAQERIAAQRPPLLGLSSKERSAAHKAWAKAMRKRGDIHTLSPDERSLIAFDYMPAEMKALYQGDATSGGFFAASDFIEELQAYKLLVSPMRKICRQQKTSGERVQMPALVNDTSVYWATEQASFVDSNDVSFGMISIPVYEMRGLLKISQTSLEDSSFDLEAFVRDRLGKNFAKKEGAAFVNGSGSGQPQGFMSFPNQATTSFPGGSAGKNNPINVIPYVQSGAATGKINADDVLNVKMDLKSDYDANAAYVFTRGTLNSIRLLKDSQNRPLWQPFAGSNLPSMIYDSRYVEMPDMPEIGVGTFPIACADFDNYLIVDRITLSMQQLNELYAASGLVGYIARMRVGGGVLLPEAFRLLKCN